MEFTDEEKAARAASIEEHPTNPTRAKPRWAKRKRRRSPKPENFEQLLDNFQANIRESYKEGWRVDPILLRINPEWSCSVLEIELEALRETVTELLATRGLTVTKVAIFQNELWFIVSP